MVGWIKMPLGKEVGLGQGNIMLDGDPAPHSSPSPLSAYAYCSQTVAHLSNCWALVSNASTKGWALRAPSKVYILLLPSESIFLLPMN